MTWSVEKTKHYKKHANIMQQTPDIKRFRRSLDSRLTQWLNCNSTNNKCCNQSLFYIRKQNTLEPTLIVI